MFVHRRTRYRPSGLVIALVNNMSPAAKRATDKQFTNLLTTASNALNLHIEMVVVQKLPGDGQDTVALLRKARPDGLIVTGAEPQRATMNEEPFWPDLARLVDWASAQTISSVWSCLAAHAAVFRLDGIERRRLPSKLSGVFTCAKTTTHALLANTPTMWPVPHSRHNTLDAEELRDQGYTVLSQGPGVGVDSFVKQVHASLFVLLQGHPEYGPQNLFHEYRRDIRRFLTGHRTDYPAMPEHYFDPDTAGVLTMLREQACRNPSLDLMDSIDAAVNRAPQPSWHQPAVRLYANWLSYLAQRKAERAAAAVWVAGPQRIAS